MKLFKAEIVKVTSGLPTVALPGEIDMFAVGAPGPPEEPELRDWVSVPPPQANCDAIRNTTAKQGAIETIEIVAAPEIFRAVDPDPSPEPAKASSQPETGAVKELIFSMASSLELWNLESSHETLRQKERKLNGGT